jgi:hypothetical protein
VTAALDLEAATAHLSAIAAGLGVRVLVVPDDEPPTSFGVAVRTDLGTTTAPGALTMTWIEPADSAEEAEVEARGEAIVEAMATEPGFLGFVGTTFARRGHTFTAWSTPETAESAVARSRPHREARERFLTGGLGRRGFTSIWVPHRLNPQHLRCPACGDRHSVPPGAATPRCPCGSPVDVAPYL